jgi:hypothetical protein
MVPLQNRLMDILRPSQRIVKVMALLKPDRICAMLPSSTLVLTIEEMFDINTGKLNFMLLLTT